MKMGKMEKFFVNSERHGRKLARWADGVLQYVPIKQGQSVLDVGCGVGMLTEHMVERYGMVATGVDIDPAQIHEARERTQHIDSVNFYVNDAVDLQFEDNRFDVVMAFKALHHVPEWRVAFNEMLRVLKPNGHLVLFDIVSPQWMGGIRLGEFGVITLDGLDVLIDEHQLDVVYTGRSGLFYKLVATGRRT